MSISYVIAYGINVKKIDLCDMAIAVYLSTCLYNFQCAESELGHLQLDHLDRATPLKRKKLLGI